MPFNISIVRPSRAERITHRRAARREGYQLLLTFWRLSAQLRETGAADFARTYRRREAVRSALIERGIFSC